VSIARDGNGVVQYKLETGWTGYRVVGRVMLPWATIWKSSR
jgi:hypothetical protein